MSFYVTHLITGLGNGGAETMLYQILKYQDNPSIKYNVVSMGAGSYYAEKIRKIGIDVLELNIRKKPLSTVVKIYKELKKTDVLCCWMYHSNFVGYIIGRLAHVKKIIWNVRHSELSKEFNKKTTLQINKWCAKHSKKVSEVIFNGYKSRTVHEAIGYYHENCVVIGNGVDTTEYQFIENARKNLLSELNINRNVKIILSVTRFHPIKDIPTFIAAFQIIHSKEQNSIAVMCGEKIDASNNEIDCLCRENHLKIGKDVYLLGMRSDIPELLSSCDVFVLHSAGEAFPNTLLQAMSCDCLCVATDVGDVRRIIDNDDFLVDVGDYYRIADKVEKLLNRKKDEILELKSKNRNAIITRFNIKTIVKQYEKYMIPKV